MITDTVQRTTPCGCDMYEHEVRSEMTRVLDSCYAAILQIDTCRQQLVFEDLTLWDMSSPHSRFEYIRSE
jgi:hypothetical protein